MRFLLVEDNLQLAGAIADRLRLDGHIVDHAGGLADGRHHLTTGEYDVILLDIGLPDGDGRDFLQEQRRRDDTPVIVITARSQVSDRVSVLDLGADDYLTKPFDFTELEARCRVVFRRRAGSGRNAITIADASLDTLAGVLAVPGGTVSLRNRELRLAEVFFAAPGRIFSKGKLVDRLFAYDEEVSENAVEVYVGRLRKHLAPTRVRIATLRGLGYRLDAPRAGGEGAR